MRPIRAETGRFEADLGLDEAGMGPDGATDAGRPVRNGGTEREDHTDILWKMGQAAQGADVAVGRGRFPLSRE